MVFYCLTTNLAFLVKSRIEADTSSTASGQATSGHSSGASAMGYPLMQPPKEFRHFPVEYQRVSYKSKSIAPRPLRQLHKVEERRAKSFAPRRLRGE